MSEHTEQLVGALFRILAEEGHTEAHRSLLEAYESTADADRGELAETLFSELLSVFDRQLDRREQVDVLATAVEQLLDRFSAVIEAVPVAILAVDANGDIELWNDGAERLFGWSEAEMRQRSYPGALSDPTGATDAYLTRLAEGEKLDGVEARHSHRDGSVLDVRIWGAPFHTRDGTFDGGTFVISDITGRKQREQRLAVLNRVLRHNIRNDVTVVKGRLEMLTEELPDDTDHVDVIDDRLSNVIELSEAARHIEQLRDQREAELTTVDLGSVVRTQTERLRAAFPDAAVEVTAPASVPVVAHELLPHAVENVVQNALEHNDATTPRVEIDVFAASEAGERAVVRVADNGPGLPEMERKVLVAETETQLDHSSGMGLWLTRWITRGSDGTIAVTESRLGGTCVEMRLRPARSLPTEPALGSGGSRH